MTDLFAGRTQGAPTDPRAWNAATLDDPACWRYALTGRSLQVLDRAVRDFASEPTTASLPEDQAAVLAGDLRPVRSALEAGRGFAIIDRVPVGRCSPGQARAVYWLIGQALGRPATQNVQGTLLYDVRDTGQDVRSGARYSVTNAETHFHTDNSFGRDVVDYVGLLCLHRARAGGRSQVVSGYTVYRELLRLRPDVLPILQRPFHIDRRGGFLAGEAPTVRLPVLEGDARALVVRYLRYWIEAGHERAGEALTAEQRHALDVLDQQCCRPDLRAEFELEPGQIFFLNNRWNFHNRTAFEDFPEPERRRHLVRLWLKSREQGSGKAVVFPDPCSLIPAPCFQPGTTFAWEFV